MEDLSYDGQTYITGVKPHLRSQQKLRAYVDNLDEKVDYAKWKQNLVLQFNYNPLKQMIEKVETQRQIYRRRINEEEQRCMKALDGKVLYEQLTLFKDFSRRLQNKINEYERDMDQTNLKNIIMIAQINDKKEELLKLNKQIRKLEVTKLQNRGIHTKHDIVRLVRSKTVATGFNMLINQKQKQQILTNSVRREIMHSRSTKKSQIFQVSNKIFYVQCLKQTMSSIRQMKGTQDVQNGIFLDVMGKKLQNKNGSYSLRSKICDTLMTKYSNKNRAKESKILNQKNDFDMSWETFSQLNWRQIMGIILVKDRQCEKMKCLLECI